MAHTLLTTDKIIRGAIMEYKNSSVALRSVTRSYDNQFGQEGAKIGDTLRVRLPQRVTTSRGSQLQVKTLEQKSVNVAIAENYQASTAYAGAELTLKLDDFQKDVVAPHMQQLASDIDTKILSNYWRIPHAVGTPGTSPAGTTVLLQVMQRFREEGYGNTPKINLLINPTTNTTLIPALQGLFNPADVVSQQFNSGLVAKRALGFNEISTTVALPNHTNGDWGTSITVGSTVTTEGASTVAISFTGSSKTWNRGDVFTIAGVNAVNPLTRLNTGSPRQFTVTEVATGSSSTTLTFYPPVYSASHQWANVTALPQSSAVVTMVGSAGATYQQNLALHEDALYFVTADHPLPKGVEMAARQQYEGVSMRFIKFYNGNTDEQVIRFDILAGDGGLRPSGGVRIWGAQV